MKGREYAAPAPSPSSGAVTRLLARIGRDPVAAASAAYLVLIAAVALLAPLVAPIDPHAIVDRPLRPSGELTLLGTDDVGRDLLSRLVHASRISLAVGVGAALLTATIGTCIGGLAGYYGGRLDAALSGLVNVMLSIPTLPLALVLSAFVEIRLPLLVLIIGGVSWTGTARIVRAQVLSLREREFVLAARALGARDGRLIVRHALVNAAPPIIVAATLQVATAILAESALELPRLRHPAARGVVGQHAAERPALYERVDHIPPVGREFLDYALIGQISPIGVWGKPSLASVEKGRRALNLRIGSVVAWVRETLDAVSRLRDLSVPFSIPSGGSASAGSETSPRRPGSAGARGPAARAARSTTARRRLRSRPPAPTPPSCPWPPSRPMARISRSGATCSSSRPSRGE